MSSGESSAVASLGNRHDAQINDNFGNHPDNSLGGECRKLASKLSIEKPPKRKLVKFAGVPGKLTQPISGRIKGLERFQQNARIFWRGLQLDLDDQFHGYSFLRRPVAKLKPLTLDRTAALQRACDCQTNTAAHQTPHK